MWEPSERPIAAGLCVVSHGCFVVNLERSLNQLNQIIEQTVKAEKCESRQSSRESWLVASSSTRSKASSLRSEIAVPAQSERTTPL